MRLDYNILWFEDQPSNIDPYVENIKNELAALGFIPNVDLRVVDGSRDPLEALPHHRDVDLVLMDFMLGGNYDGASLSKRVRHFFKYTDIVFYSSEVKTRLRQLIFEQDIDGVHCCSRTNLTDNTLSIIQTQMRKVLDLNHMRGIVMATTSDLDHAMIECLSVVHELAYPGNANAFATIINTKVAHQLNKKIADVAKLAGKGDVKKLLTNPNFSAEMRLDALQAELKKLGLPDSNVVEKLGVYLREVITPRNDFAHRRAVVRDEELFLDGRNEAFSQQSMTELRQRLMAHGDNLQALLELLKRMTQESASPPEEASVDGAAVDMSVGTALSTQVSVQREGTAKASSNGVVAEQFEKSNT